MNKKIYSLLVIVVIAIAGCSTNQNESRIQAPPFPYEAYLELSEEDQ